MLKRKLPMLLALLALSGCDAIAGRTLGPPQLVCAPFALDSTATPSPQVSVCWQVAK